MQWIQDGWQGSSEKKLRFSASTEKPTAKQRKNVLYNLKNKTAEKEATNEQYKQQTIHFKIWRKTRTFKCRTVSGGI